VARHAWLVPKYTMCQLELIFMTPHIYEFIITTMEIHMLVPSISADSCSILNVHR